MQDIKEAIGLLRSCSGRQWINEKECEIILTHLYKTGMKYDAVEIGTWNGITATGMGLIAKLFDSRKRIYSIDNYVGHPNLDVTSEVALQNYRNNIKKYNLQDYCELIIANSEDIEFDKEIGFLFIDGGHSYEQIKKDIEKWIPKVAKNGIIIFHDYSNAFPDVVKAIEESNLGGHKEGGSLYVARK